MDAGTLQLSGLCPLLSGFGNLVAKAQSKEHEGCTKEGVFKPDNNICVVNVKCLN